MAYKRKYVKRKRSASKKSKRTYKKKTYNKKKKISHVGKRSIISGHIGGVNYPVVINANRSGVKPLPNAQYLPWQKYMYNETETVIAGPDAQGVRTHVETMDSTDLFQINQFATGTLANLVGSGAPATPNSCHQLYMKDIHINSEFMNTSAITAVVDVYTLICRRSCNKTPEDMMSAMSNTVAVPTNSSSWTYATVGASPYDCPQLVANWKIVNKKSKILAGGETFNMTHKVKVNKVYDQAMMYNELDGGEANVTQYLSGLTITTLVIVRGTPTAGVGNPNDAGLGGVKLAMWYNTKINYRILSGYKKHMDYESFNTGFSNLTAVTQTNQTVAVGTAGSFYV